MIRRWQLWTIRLVVLALYGAVCWPVPWGYFSWQGGLFSFLLGGAVLAWADSLVFAVGVVRVLTDRIDGKDIKYLLVAGHRIAVDNNKLPRSTVLFACRRSRYRVLFVGEGGLVLAQDELNLEDKGYAEVEFGRGDKQE